MSGLPAALGAVDLLGLFGHFMMLSLLAVGGAITTAPDMHRYLVTQQHWLSDTQFTTAIAIAQAAPGPNVLFVAVLGWNVAGPIGALATMVGTLLPSTLLSLSFTRWAANRRDSLGLRAFVAGLAPLTIGLMLSTGWVLTLPFLREGDHRIGAIVLLVLTVGLSTRLSISPLWLVALGAAAGMLGWV